LSQQGPRRRRPLRGRARAEVWSGRDVDATRAPSASCRGGLGATREALHEARASARTRRTRTRLHHQARPSSTARVESRRRPTSRTPREARRRRDARCLRAWPHRRRIRRRVHRPLPHQHARRRCWRRSSTGAPRMNTDDINIDALLKRLHLANARRTWRDLVARAEKEQWSFRDFLAILVAEEVAHRRQTRIQRYSSRSGFPFLKTIDDFDFTYQSTVKLSLLGSALSPDFITDGRNLVLHGKSGRGKTHVAVAVGYRAIQNGFDTIFVTAAELIEDL